VAPLFRQFLLAVLPGVYVSFQSKSVFGPRTLNSHGFLLTLSCPGFRSKASDPARFILSYSAHEVYSRHKWSVFTPQHRCNTPSLHWAPLNDIELFPRKLDP